MRNPLEGMASFVFGGQEWHLKLDNRAFYHAEDVLGFSVLDAVEQMRAALAAGKNPMLKTIVALVYGGLKLNHPQVDEDTVISMFMSEDPAVREAVLKAMRGAQMPDIQPPTGPAGQAGNAPQGNRTTRGGTGS